MIFGSSQNVLISGRTVYQFMPEKLKRFTLRKAGWMLICHNEGIMSENLITKSNQKAYKNNFILCPNYFFTLTWMNALMKVNLVPARVTVRTVSASFNQGNRGHPHTDYLSSAGDGGFDTNQYHLLPIGSEEREVLGVGSIPVAILSSFQYMKNIAL